MKRKVTSGDVAKLAQVSQATVSYVLNNTPGKRIPETTKKRVLKAAAELNYIPNNAARALKTNRTNCIAVRFATNLSLDRYQLILQGIRSYLEPAGCSILLCTGKKQQNGLPDFINACLNTQADGIIYISSDRINIPVDVMSQINSRSIPLAAIDCMEDDVTVSSICYDYFASTYLRAEYFINQGFKNFIYLRPIFSNIKESTREKGIKAAVCDNDDLQLDIHQIICNDPNSSEHSFTRPQEDFTKESLKQIKQIINSAPKDSCILGSTDRIQMYISNYLYQNYLQQPGKEVIPWYSRSITYHFVHFDAGFESARSLLNIIDDKNNPRKLALRPIIDMIDPDMF